MGEGRNIVAELEAEADWRRTEAETLRAEIERLKAALQEMRAGIMDCSGDIIDERILEQIAASIDKALEGEDG